MALVPPPASERPSARPNQCPCPAVACRSLEAVSDRFYLLEELEGGVNLRGQVFDFLHPYWRVRYSDQNWEELSRRELERLPVCR